MEPISATVITALVGLYTAYTTYKAGVAQAQAQGQPAPTKTDKAQQGEQVAQVIETGIQQYGGGDAQAALTGFTQNPQMFASVLEQALANLAQREPTFAQQLQRVAEQTNVAQAGGVHGTATVSGTNYGQNIGVNTGTMNQSTQTINNQSSNKGAQGTFHGPVNFGRDE